MEIVTADGLIVPAPTRPSNCPGCTFKTRTINAKGPIDAQFVIVGEGPGNRELAAGYPFMGSSGTMIEETLKSVGYDPVKHGAIYYANAVQCFPSNKDKGIMNTAAACCQKRLMQELRAHPRKVILCLGAAASWAVTNDFGIKITMERGRVIQSELASEGIVLAVHPAFLIRNGAGYPFWKKDLEVAVNLLNGNKKVGWTPPEHEVITSREAFQKIIPYYTQPGRLNTGDIETDQLHWFGGKILCHGITTGDGSMVHVIPEHIIDENIDLMRDLMDPSKAKWSWHNGMFDITWLRAPQYGIHACVDHDTMLMSYSMNENRGFHDLDQVTQQWIAAPRHKHMLDQYLPSKATSYRVIPSDILHKYNAIDLSKQHASFAPLHEAVCADKNANKLYHNLLIPACEELVRMRLHGVQVDIEQVKANEEALDAQIIALANQINEEYAIPKIGMPINIGSPSQLAGLLYDKLGLTLPGTRSTAEDSLILIQRRYDHPIVNLILQHRELVKRRGTYVSNILRKKTGSGKAVKYSPGHMKADGCVYADFALHKTATGRLAGSDPNLLNQPRVPEIRSQYKARKGKVFVEVDENQAELRSLAAMSGDPTLVEIYNKNEISIHDVTTGAFFAPKEEIMLGTSAYERNRVLLHLPVGVVPDYVYKEAKMRGKAVNFGIVYGREAHSLAVEFNISVREAQRWIDTWFATYPRAAEFIKWCRGRPAEGKDLVTVFGRKKRHGLVAKERLKALQNEAANFPHQSTASDFMLEALIRVGPQLRERYNAHPWNEVYDAIYYEIDANNGMISESIELVQDTLVAIPPEYGITRVPFLADAKVGPSWGTMKDWKGSLEATLGEDWQLKYCGA